MVTMVMTVVMIRIMMLMVLMVVIMMTMMVAVVVAMMRVMMMMMTLKREHDMQQLDCYTCMYDRSIRVIFIIRFMIIFVIRIAPIR